MEAVPDHGVALKITQTHLIAVVVVIAGVAEVVVVQVAVAVVPRVVPVVVVVAEDIKSSLYTNAYQF